MGKTDTTTRDRIVNKIISQSIANTIMNEASTYSNSSTNIQLAYNTTACYQSQTIQMSTIYAATSSVLMKQSNMQKLYATIQSQLSSDQDVSQTGLGGFGQLDTQTVDTIQNVLQTVLVSDAISNVDSSIANNNVNFQGCISSVGTAQYLYDTEKNLYTVYTSQYSTNMAVQSVTANISNILQSSQTVKRQGILATIIYAIMFVIIALIVVVAVAAVIVVLVLL